MTSYINTRMGPIIVIICSLGCRKGYAYIWGWEGRVVIVQIKANMKYIHTTIVNTYLNSRNRNKVTTIIPLNVHHSETTLPHSTRRTITRTNKCPTLHSYLNKIDESAIATMSTLQNRTTHNTHLFRCTKIDTHLKMIRPVGLDID